MALRTSLIGDMFSGFKNLFKSKDPRLSESLSKIDEIFTNGSTSGNLALKKENYIQDFLNQNPKGEGQLSLFTKQERKRAGRQRNVVNVDSNVGSEPVATLPKETYDEGLGLFDQANLRDYANALDNGGTPGNKALAMINQMAELNRNSYNIGPNMGAGNIIRMPFNGETVAANAYLNAQRSVATGMNNRLNKIANQVQTDELQNWLTDNPNFIDNMAANLDGRPLGINVGTNGTNRIIPGIPSNNTRVVVGETEEQITDAAEAAVAETNGENGRNWVRYAVGAATGGGLVFALSDSRGQQTNAQLYGQQPLY